MIGTASGIPYGAFAAALAPTALIGLAICWLVIVLSYQPEFRSGAFVVPEGQPVRIYKPLMRKIAVVIPAMLLTLLVALVLV